ncbi:hypothetical protein [Bradyrhizobium sp. CCBAU 53421]|uniref:hypothetical protein n=1 Tax=Bradyrhizobium sp. CCBAU 53421 TaxID=1325120 RepID=UPI00188A10EE|nr:hypothetical protein [Bradyrhizobium sp. CCBAU 53421]
MNKFDHEMSMEALDRVVGGADGDGNGTGTDNGVTAWFAESSRSSALWKASSNQFGPSDLRRDRQCHAIGDARRCLVNQ